MIPLKCAVSNCTRLWGHLRGLIDRFTIHKYSITVFLCYLVPHFLANERLRTDFLPFNFPLYVTPICCLCRAWNRQMCFHPCNLPPLVCQWVWINGGNLSILVWLSVGSSTENQLHVSNEDLHQRKRARDRDKWRERSAPMATRIRENGQEAGRKRKRPRIPDWLALVMLPLRPLPK